LSEKEKVLISTKGLVAEEYGATKHSVFQNTQEKASKRSLQPHSNAAPSVMLLGNIDRWLASWIFLLKKQDQISWWQSTCVLGSLPTGIQ
jgi:hypothetical protein